MKGLIIKDVMCLKKQLMMFVYVLIGVLVISVMFVLSAKLGNLAAVGQDMVRSDSELSVTDVQNMAVEALVLFMLLPLAVVCDISHVFTADGKAGFYKISGAFPIPLYKRLLARYLTIFVFFGMGTLIDIVIAFVLSRLTDLITFREFLGIILSAASVMSIYSALMVFFCFVFGYGKESYAQIASLFSMAAAVILMNLRTIREIMTGVVDREQFSGWEILDFIKYKAWILILIAAFVSLLSYGASYLITERKRGVI